MAELNFCTTCYALTNPEDAKDHAAHHLHIDARLNALTRNNTDYLQQVATLKQQVVAYGRQLDAHPISMDPETITISAAPDFDPEDLIETTGDDEDAYAGEPDEDAPVTPTASTTEDYTYPLAIDRDDDDLDTRLANATSAQPTI